jgi:hypothetical protein
VKAGAIDNGGTRAGWAEAQSARRAAAARLSVRKGLLCTLLASTVLLGAGVASAAAALPDGRAWELVSPADKHGAFVEPLGLGQAAPNGGLIVAAEDGNSISYVANSPVTSQPEGNRATEGNQVLARRGGQGWSSQDIVTAHLQGEGLPSDEPQEYQAFSPDLSLALVAPWAKNGVTLQEPPLVPGAASEELGLYLRHETAPCKTAAAPCYEPIVNEVDNTTKTPFGKQLRFSGASPDLNHVVFNSGVALKPGAPSGEHEGMYEWNAIDEKEITTPEGKEVKEKKQLQLVSQLPAKQQTPENEAAFEPQLGNDYLAERSGLRNAVSHDGSRIFFTGLPTEENERPLGEGRNLYMHSTTSGTTMEVESKEGKLVQEGSSRFQAASSDGSTVFFTDTRKLTSDSLAKESKETEELRKADLYVCEIEPSNEGAQTCPKMTDLTGSGHGFGTSADVVGAVLGASESGSTVYFVANGVDANAAAAGATNGTCPNPNNAHAVTPLESCNLYVAHRSGAGWEEPRLVAVLSAEDGPDWGRSGRYLSELTARVSPSGQYLAFMSERPLTNYDNRDANPAAHEAPDEEVFLYNSSGAGSLACVSCNPDSTKRPTGVFDTRNAGEGEGLLVDPLSRIWEGHWLAGSIPPWTALTRREAPYQSRFLLDTGRVYFDSADSLVPEDSNKRVETIPGEGEQEVGVEDVYQYEPEGQGSCQAGAVACVSLISSGTDTHESAFVDASASGNDVFFVTSQSLFSTDIDTAYDLYDARACSEGSPCLTPPPPAPAPCGDEGSCRSTGGGGTPGFGSASSETALGPPSVSRLQTLPFKTTVKTKPKPLTRAQKLKRALAACRKAHRHSKHKRMLCERQAKHKYGAHKAKKKAAKK